MHAIISDIHDNQEALEAVLADIRRQGIQRIICLGDVVGYGPDPEACIDLVAKNCEWCLSGNHDYAVLTEAAHFNPIAAEAIDCIRERLKPRFADMYNRKHARWRFLESLLLRKQEGDTLYVHGSPRDERNEYITPFDVAYGETPKIVEIFDQTPRLLFVGHSHLPGVITDKFQFITPAEMDYRFPLRNGKLIINVGSVGQPRDGDNRACYVTVTDDELRYHRLVYDYQTTMKKIYDLACINHYCADRLAMGR